MFPEVRIYTMVCLIVSIMALAVLEQTSGVEILDCGPGKPLVVEEATTNFEVNCINIHQGFEVSWFFNFTQQSSSVHMKAVHCYRKIRCLKYFPYLGLQRTPYTIALNISEFIKFFRLNRITCQENSRYGELQVNSYTCDISITSPPEISCHVQYYRHSGVDMGHCDVTKIHFRDRLYTCRWFQIKENNEDRSNYVEQYVTNYVDDGPHASAICTNTAVRLSNETFTYEVLLLPDGIRVQAKLIINE